MAVLAWVAILIVLVYAIGATVLAVRGRGAPDLTRLAPDGLHYVFIVPCLNEELVIGRTLDGLLALPADRTSMVVVDDGSDDGTAAVVSQYAERDDRVRLIRRELPEARRGKGRALNAAFAEIRSCWLDAGADPRRVIVTVVDADGRVDADILDKVGPVFADDHVGAAQTLVRIHNRQRVLTRIQDIEFVVFSGLYQRARNSLGSVGLGGNGQFVRLAALMDLGARPWSDALTEDLELGVQLILAGWRNVFVPSASISQQAVTGMRALLRQRTRWTQGHMQCWHNVPALVTSPLPNRTVLDMLYYLLAPALLALYSLLFPAGWALLGYEVFAAPGGAAHWLTQHPYTLVFWYAMAFLPPVLWLVPLYRRAGRSEIGLLRTILYGHALVPYCMIWYVAFWRALARQVTGRRGWAKTRRVEEAPAPAALRWHELMVMPDGPLDPGALLAAMGLGPRTPDVAAVPVAAHPPLADMDREDRDGADVPAALQTPPLPRPAASGAWSRALMLGAVLGTALAVQARVRHRPR